MSILRFRSKSSKFQETNSFRSSYVLSSLHKIPFFIKLFHWEYWPMFLTQFPVLIFWLISALRTGKLAFFTAVNPAIETGGLFGESKIKILDTIPEKLLPKTLFIPVGKQNLITILTQLQTAKISFPIIIKPNIGERGMRVEKIKNEAQLVQYLQNVNYDFLIQEYIDYKLELSVLCYQIPNSKEGAITSICQKEFLSVTGNGESTLSELIEQQPRAVLQKKALYLKHQAIWNEVLPKGQQLLLQPIGNHSLGTKFLNANPQIDEELTQRFLSVLDQMPDVHYGRFDLRAKNWEDLKTKGAFKVMEFNGVGSEPAHIYDPDYRVWKAYRDIWQHWKIMVKIYKAQRKNRISAISFVSLLKEFRRYKRYIRSVGNE